ncbi:MAG: translation initiation factor IF-2 N-terminal domain-containing protein, partial [Bryobacteraceae bacterium]
MSKVRINELARECEQPNSAVLALLAEFGVTEKKTHSSSIDADVADKIRRRFGIHVETPEAESAGALAQPAEGAPEAAPFAPGPSGEPSLSELAPGGEQPPAATAAPELFPLGWTLEERFSARPAAHPLRPPLLGGGPRPAFVQPTAGAAPAGMAPPSAVTAPGLAARPVVAGRTLPSTPRPGQIISGP